MLISICRNHLKSELLSVESRKVRFDKSICHGLSFCHYRKNTKSNKQHELALF